MKKLLTRLARYYHFFYIAFVFLATVFLLYLIIPGESRFKYEFQKCSLAARNLDGSFQFCHSQIQ